MKTISKMTQIILQQPGELTNRQVADRLNIDIKTVADARRRHGVKHASPKRCRGAAELVAAQYGRKDAGAVAAEIGCSRVYVNQIWRQIREGNN